MPPDGTYTLTDLAQIADTTPRTVRYYVQQGLLPAPAGAGPGAHYTDSHLSRLRLIKRLQREHLPLAEIRSRLEPLDDQEIEALGATGSPTPGTSALDYVRSVLGSRGMPAMADRSSLSQVVLGNLAVDIPAAAAEPAVLAPSPELAHESARSQWDRIALAPDIELHVRRPLARRQNRMVERLIALARQLLEEEKP